jgi:hypothetical protein
MATIVLRSQKGEPLTFSEVDSNFTELNDDLADRYTKAEADARYVQGTTQTENTFTATAGQTAFTLSEAAASSSSIMVTVDGVVQPTSAYSLSMDGLTLTLAEAPGNGASVRVLILGVAGNTNAPGDDTVTTVKLRDGAVTAAKLDDGAVTTAKLAFDGGPLAGMRNAIINGNFDIWQRGTSFTGGEYGADRWRSLRVGTTCTMSRQAFTLGQTDVPGEPTYFVRMAVTSVAGAGNVSQLQQKIEGVRTFADQQITVSFYAKADSTKNIAIEFVQNFGTGGSPSASVLAIGTVKKSLTTSWQKITHTLTVPSISGKTLGTDGDDIFIFNVFFDAGSNFNSLGHQSGTFDIAQVQVEAGPVATPFERRPIGTELALCQRYYTDGNLMSGGAGGRRFASITSSIHALGSHSFPQAMRSTPSVVISNVTFVNCSDIATHALSRNGFSTRVDASVNASYHITSGSFTADAEL